MPIHKSNRRIIALLIGVIVILIGVIVFIAIRWDSPHLKECWSYYASTVIGSGGLISLIPTLIDVYKTRNYNIILDDIKRLIDGYRKGKTSPTRDTNGGEK